MSWSLIVYLFLADGSWKQDVSTVQADNIAACLSQSDQAKTRLHDEWGRGSFIALCIDNETIK